MKILFAINQSRVLYDFKRELVEASLARGDDAILSFEEDFRADYFRKTRATIVPTPIDPRGVNPWRDLKLYRFYKRLLRAERPDLVLTFTIKPNVYCGRACAKLGVPYMATLSGLGAAMNGGGIDGALSRRAEGRVARILPESGDCGARGSGAFRAGGADRPGQRFRGRFRSF